MNVVITNLRFRLNLNVHTTKCSSINWYYLSDAPLDFYLNLNKYFFHMQRRN